MLVSLEGTATVATGGCSYIIKPDEKELLELQFGENAFFGDALCTNPVEGVCKFTSGQLDGISSAAFSS